LPDLTPYNFVADNPLRFVDGDGKFLLDVHERIMANALKQFDSNFFNKYSSGSANYENSQFLDGMIGRTGGRDKSDYLSAGIANPDIHHSGFVLESNYSSSMHFDNMKYPEIMGNMAKIQSMLNSNVEAYNSGHKNAYELGHDVGVASHAIQDFYSHSNYVELYQKTYPEQTDFTKIPTIEDALSNPEFKKFASVLAIELRTGEYPGNKDNKSHKVMNHDLGFGSQYYKMDEVKGKKADWFSKAAETVAAKAEMKLLKNVKGKLKIK
jgi:hypothetical protein